jgi:hypothetical protein
MQAKLAVAAIVMLAAGSALAAGPMLQQGVREGGVRGAMDHDGDNLGATVMGKVGYFVMDGAEVGISGLLGFRGSDSRTLAGGLFGQYNFFLGTPVVPFAGAGTTLSWMKWSLGNESDSDAILGFNLEGGAKFYFIDYAAISLSLQLLYATKEVYNGFDSNTDWQFVLGTNWYF